ncbi:MAG: DUF2865 domain-containing protein [Roseiarcus sp.]
MTGRHGQGSSSAEGIARLSFWRRAAPPRRAKRRALRPFLTGCGLAVLGFCSPQAGVAAGPIGGLDNPSLVISPADQGGAQDEGEASSDANVVWSPLDPRSENAWEAAATTARTVPGASSPPRRSVCVRLCDGYYFPIGPLSGDADLGDHKAACSGLCPDAPTQLFIEPSGSEAIEDAVAEDGARYSALPTAFRSRTVIDKTCACHRGAGQAFPLRDDFTLRSGDSIMTPSGVVVFRGTGHSPFAQDDFAALANVEMARDKRALLAAIEHAAEPNIVQPVKAFSPRPDAGIAFAPMRGGSSPDSPDDSIRFVEPPSSATN